MPDVEAKKSEEKEEKKSHKEKKEEKKIAELEEQLAKAKADMEHWKNEYYRAYADTKNLRSSLEKDHQQFIKYRAEGFVDSLLPVLDSFYMVLGNEPSDPVLKNYLIGFQYIYRNLVAALESEGVIEITPEVGSIFDANTMNAVEANEVEDEKEVNKITKIFTKGYKLHDRLIRPANVMVNKLKEVKTEEAKEADKVEENAQEEKADA